MMGWDTMGLDVGFLGPLSWGQYQWHEEIGRCHLHMHKRRDLLLLEAAINHHSKRLGIQVHPDTGQLALITCTNDERTFRLPLSQIHNEFWADGANERTGDPASLPSTLSNGMDWGKAKSQGQAGKKDANGTGAVSGPCLF